MIDNGTSIKDSRSTGYLTVYNHINGDLCEIIGNSQMVNFFCIDVGKAQLLGIPLGGLSNKSGPRISGGAGFSSTSPKIQGPLNLAEVTKSYTGSFIYNKIPEMWLGEPETIILTISPDVNADLDIPSAIKGVRIEGNTSVTATMSVEAIGSAGLEVKNEGSAKKILSNLAPASWQWRITPIAPGSQSLRLTIYVHVDGDKAVTLQTYQETVSIKVYFWKRIEIMVASISPTWAFLVAFVTAVSGVTAWARSKMLKNKKKDWVPFHKRDRP